MLYSYHDTSPSYEYCSLEGQWFYFVKAIEFSFLKEKYRSKTTPTSLKQKKKKESTNHASNPLHLNSKTAKARPESIGAYENSNEEIFPVRSPKFGRLWFFVFQLNESLKNRWVGFISLFILCNSFNLHKTK